jgi:CHASE2 domain-containing sensor protein
MGRKVLAVVVSMIAAMGVILISQMLNSFLVMPPSAEVMNDPVKMRAFLDGLPTMAYVIVLVGYFLGSFAGGFLVRNMSRRESPGTGLAILIGVLLTVAGLLNFFVFLPGQPIWFIAFSLLTFVPVSLLGYKFAGR